MLEVYSNQEPARVGYFQSVLENAGIACFVRNGNSSNVSKRYPEHLYAKKVQESY